MAATVDELGIDYFEDDLQTVKQLDKVVLTKGAWATIVYKYQDWDRTKEVYGPEKYTFRRYQKRNGEYKQKSKFNITNVEQAKSIVSVLQNWIADAE